MRSDWDDAGDRISRSDWTDAEIARGEDPWSGVNQNTGGDYTTGDSGVIVPIILLVGISLLIMSLLMAK